MSTNTTCQVCKQVAAKVKTCKSCGHKYCEKCQSLSTHQDFCKDCVAMEGVISKD